MSKDCPLHLQQPLQMREHFHASLQDPMHVGDGDTVVSDWYLLIFGTFHPVPDLPFIQHAASAVDDQRIGGEVFRETLPGTGGNGEILSGMFFQPVWNLHRSDIIALTVVGTSLSNEDGIAVF